jgi:hypothetical protein
MLRALPILAALALTAPASAQVAAAIPRTANGKPDLQGIWQVHNRAAYGLEYHEAKYLMPAGPSVVDGGEIPYLPAAREQQRRNFADRATADPLASCYLPGVPRIMYMEYPFQIFQTAEHVAITFEWSQIYRLIYTAGQPTKHEGIESWMGNSRGRWEGDVLVVEVTDHNDRTWLDAAGTFHSNALRVTERYAMRDANTIDYQATIEDPNVFSRSWTIRVPLHRQTDLPRLYEYQCQAEKEEANGDFERDARTWYPAPIPAENVPFDARAGANVPPPAVKGTIRRLPDGKPDISGWYELDAGGGNYGIEARPQNFLTPPSRGLLIDPANGVLPYQAWARQERTAREAPHRGYDDPTAHCFVAGLPRSQYVPQPVQILQPPGFVVVLFERMSWRHIALNPRPALPDHVRLWQGDSQGRWEGDTLVVESKSFNGKAWLNELGDITSHAQTLVERFTPVDEDTVIYRATVSDPIPYTRPWTIEVPMRRRADELLEVACHEDNADLEHLRHVRDEYRAAQEQGQRQED